jgi:threonine dehydrogenase-like Zn-dependent dehydrogenase
MAHTLVAGDEVIVVGAGVVGIAIALHLQLAGFASPCWTVANRPWKPAMAMPVPLPSAM